MLHPILQSAMKGNLFPAILHSADHLFNSDGAWWILSMNGLLLIPLMFAIFFYPMAVLIILAVMALLTVGGLVVARVVDARRHRHP